MKNSETRPGARARRKSPGNLILGMTFLIIGSLLFAREFGADLPSWLFRWEVIVITVGIIIGLKSGFRDFGWIVISGVGFFFLSDDIFPGWNASRFIAPVAILALGAFIILNRLSPSRRERLTEAGSPDADGSGEAFGPGGTAESLDANAPYKAYDPARPGQTTDRGRPDQANDGTRPAQTTDDPRPGQAADRSRPGQTNEGNRTFEPSDAARPDNRQTSGQTFPSAHNEPFGSHPANEQYQTRRPNGEFINRGQMEEEQLEIVSVFSAVNRKVFSKNFVGGEIVCVFGGSEVNFMNADISAGTVELEVVCIFGGATLFIPPNWHVRSEMGSVFGGVDDKRKNPVPDHSRTLIIKGVCIFGGLEIKTKYS